MAGKIKRMGQIKQLLRMHHQGIGKKAISRALGISKNTVKEYLKKLEPMSIDIEKLLNTEEMDLEKLFFSGSPAYKDTRYDDLKPQLDYYVKELERTGVTRQLLWEEYKENKEHYYRYTQFCYHLQQHQQSSKPSMVLTHHPGDKLYVDFTGDKLEYIDMETGEVVACEVFVACLPYSDYGYAIAVESQRVDDFIYALNQSLIYFGGVPKTIVTDNLKSAVIKSHRYEPKINQALDDLANHYGTTITPTRVYKPQDKALVENHVKLIYNRIFAKMRNMRFYDLASLNVKIMELLKQHNQTRMQQKDYCREEKFIAEEVKHLASLPSTAYEMKYYKELKVAANGHIMLWQDKHYYSVPYQYIGQQVKVVYTRSMVSIYHNRQQIALHQRNYAKGKYTYNPEHLCSHHRHYLKLSPEYYAEQAGKISLELQELINQMFNESSYPEHLYRRCDGLLNLGRKTEKERFAKACRRAIDCHVYTYHFIENLLTNNVIDQELKINYKPLPLHENTRGSEYYC